MDYHVINIIVLQYNDRCRTKILR